MTHDQRESWSGADGGGEPGPGAAAEPETAAIDERLSVFDRWLARLGLRKARRLIIGILGVSTLLVGVLMMLLPGPAFIVIPLGFAILATEFIWARRAMRRLYNTTLFAVAFVGLRDRIEGPLARIAYRAKLISREEMERQVAEAQSAPRATPLQRRRLVLTLLVLVLLLVCGIVIGWNIVSERRAGEPPEPAPRQGPPADA